MGISGSLPPPMPPAIYRLMDNQWLHKPLIKAGYRVLGGIVSGITPGPVGIFMIYDEHMSQKPGTFHPGFCPGFTSWDPKKTELLIQKLLASLTFEQFGERRVFREKRRSEKPFSSGFPGRCIIFQTEVWLLSLTFFGGGASRLKYTKISRPPAHSLMAHVVWGNRAVSSRYTTHGRPGATGGATSNQPSNQHPPGHQPHSIYLKKDLQTYIININQL